MNIPFICSNISAAPAYGVYITQLMRYYRACGSYQEDLHGRLLLNRKGVELRVPIGKVEVITSTVLRSNRELVNRYRISMSQMTTDMFSLSITILACFPLSWLITGCLTRVTWLVGATCEAGTVYTFKHVSSSRMFIWVRVAEFLFFSVVFCRPSLLFCPFSLCHCIVYTFFENGFLLSILISSKCSYNRKQCIQIISCIGKQTTNTYLSM